MDKFYMIFVEGKGTPSVHHLTRLEAKNEAERLARLHDNIGRRVYVLEAVDYCVAEDIPVRWVELRSCL